MDSTCTVGSLVHVDVRGVVHLVLGEGGAASWVCLDVELQVVEVESSRTTPTCWNPTADPPQAT